MGYYHTAQICLNGHLISSTIDVDVDFNQNFCLRCGAKTIKNCPSCNSPIRGEYDDEFCVIIKGEFPVPSYCPDCGNPYPWTEQAINSAKMLIMEEDDLSEQSKYNLVESLPSLIVETPSTVLATTRTKKALSSVGKFTADALRQFVIDFGCELAKKSLGL